MKNTLKIGGFLAAFGVFFVALMLFVYLRGGAGDNGANNSDNNETALRREVIFVIYNDECLARLEERDGFEECSGLAPEMQLPSALNIVRLREVDGEYFLLLPYWARGGYDAGVVVFLSDYLPAFTTMYGSRIPTIFMQTESGGLDFIHAAQENREGVDFLFVCEDGFFHHQSSGDMNGRGNYTWRQPKRPYNFRLAAGENMGLFGLGAGRHWTLLANYMDDSLIRNTIALNLARQLGISHTSRLRPVDVFINGVYVGVYDLVERRNLNHAVDIVDLQAFTAAVNPLPLAAYPHSGVHEVVRGTMKYFEIPYGPPDITGGYLLEIQFPRRYMHAPSGFVSTRGAVVNLRAPHYASRAQVSYISDFFQRIEDAVYSVDGMNANGDFFWDLLCISSFAMMHLFSEFIMDSDTANSSFFMYKQPDRMGSGRLYAGPPWDFDFTLGVLHDLHGVNFHDATLWWAGAGYIDLDPENEPHILHALWKHEIFRNEVKRLWQEEAAAAIRFLVGLDENVAFLDNFIPITCYMEAIADSHAMDRLIWPLTPEGGIFSYQVPCLPTFALERFEFLDSHWGVR